MTGSATATVVVDGKALAQPIRAQLAEEIAELVGGGHRPPCLAVVLVGDNPASLSYIKGKRRACERVGMASREHNLPAERDARRTWSSSSSRSIATPTWTASWCSSRCPSRCRRRR